MNTNVSFPKIQYKNQMQKIFTIPIFTKFSICKDMAFIRVLIVKVKVVCVNKCENW